MVCVCVEAKNVKLPKTPKGVCSTIRENFVLPQGMWYWCRKAGAGLGGCGAISQVKKIPPGQRAHISLKTAVGLLTTVNSSGLWDPGDLPPPGLLDTLFTVPSPSQC